MANQFTWVPFYKEFARILLQYQDKRKELIEKVKEIYTRTGINMPTLEVDNNIIDIDPFTVFGLFNKSSMREDNRIKILRAIKDIFYVQEEVPPSFDSIPVLNNMNATFYWFVGGRGETDIDDLWHFYRLALIGEQHGLDSIREELYQYFNLVINKSGNGNSKITMGLYWIAPDLYLNLDSRNTWYIYESGIFSKAFVSTLPKVEAKISAEVYFNITESVRKYIDEGNCEFKDFKELSFEAWKYSKKVNEELRGTQTAIPTINQKGSGLADEDVDTIRYWMYSPGDGASKWNDFYHKGVMGLGWSKIGDYSQYSSKDEMRTALQELINPSLSFKNTAHATWQFLTEMKPGDVIFVKKGRNTLIGRGVVTSAYMFDEEDEEYPNVRKVNWTHSGNWDLPSPAAMKTLTDISSYTDYIEQIKSLLAVADDTEGEDPVEPVYPKYSVEKYLEEVYMTRDDYDTLVDLLEIKKNVILQGAPGVGKTFAAKRLAYSIIGEKNQDRVMMVQFHQSYTYEDFIEGFRPCKDGAGFEIKKGAFYNFCKKAEEDKDNTYFFIIDEINRGNLSKIFGELFMLIEKDKRDNALQLLYSGEKFLVPGNIRIIGMMNTADRSLAMLDYALRRRFAFFEMKPGFDSEGFRNYQAAFSDHRFDSLISCVERLNKEITQDESLGEGFCIGHSYFCNLTALNEKSLSNIVKYEMIPLLKEYWYDEPEKVKEWSDKLRSSIQ